jgi:RNA polymerase sigma factor (sigma-70 family)
VFWEESDLEDALAWLAHEEGEEAAALVRPIAWANWQRIGKYLQRNPDNSLRDYVHTVHKTHRRLHPKIHKIQIERSPELWDDLFGQMQKWVYNYLLGQGFYRSSQTLALAVEYATEAAIALLQSRFPYDVEFEPWAITLTQNVCRKQIRQAVRHTGNEDMVKTDEEIRQILTQEGEDAEQLRQELLEIVAELTPKTWQTVILLHYFEGLSLKDVAQTMGQSISSIYNIHFKALKRLNEIWHKHS